MTLTVLQLPYVIAVDSSLVVSFTFTNKTKRNAQKFHCLTQKHRWPPREMARKRERNLKKRIRARKRTKESREKRKEGGRKTKSTGKEGVAFHWNGPPNTNCFLSLQGQNLGCFSLRLSSRGVNTVHGPNFNPDWITWKERELPGPSVKMKKTEVDFVKVKKEEKKWSCWAPLEATCHENPPKS